MISEKSRQLRAFVDALREELGLDPLYGGGRRGRRYRVWPCPQAGYDVNGMRTLLGGSTR